MPVLAKPVATAVPFKALETVCSRVVFQPGDRLRDKGQHYLDMYVLTSGSVDVDRHAANRRAEVISLGAGDVIGEIAFLRGCPATATVTARTGVEALVVDDVALSRLECDHPLAAADLMRFLAKVAEDRTNVNLTLEPVSARHANARRIEVLLCRDQDMLERAQQLRYDVYCRELGRSSPYADAQKGIIADDLDNTGHTFIAVEDGELTGTLRANRASDGGLGILEELYGMRQSAHHPHATGICTKFIVRKAKRGGPTAFALIAAMVRLGIQHNIQACYIDCIPALLPYYRALGFQAVGEVFLHRENGPSQPMVLDLTKHGPRLSRGWGPLAYLRMMARATVFKLV